MTDWRVESIVTIWKMTILGSGFLTFGGNDREMIVWNVKDFPGMTSHSNVLLRHQNLKVGVQLPQRDEMHAQTIESSGANI